MVKHFLLAAILLSCLLCEARACTIIFPTPAVEFQQSQVVALALPTAISYRPKEAAKVGFVGPYQQTVLWRVLLAWKGAVKSGDSFTTRLMFSGNPEECSSYSPVGSKNARLVFAQGREPYPEFHGFELARAQDYFLYLAARATR